MSETIEHFQDDKDASSRLLSLITQTRTRFDISISSDRLPFFIQHTGIVDGCKALVKKNVEMRFILQAPPKKPEDYKLLSSIASKIKYLDGIEGISAISDSKYFI